MGALLMIFLIPLIVVGLIFASIANSVSKRKAERESYLQAEKRRYEESLAQRKSYTTSNSQPVKKVIPEIQSKEVLSEKSQENKTKENLRYYNSGSSIYHNTKECYEFSLVNEWHEIPEAEALEMNLQACDACAGTTVFMYSKGKTYHKTKSCFDPKLIPIQMSEDEAIKNGLHRCKKCW